MCGIVGWVGRAPAREMLPSVRTALSRMAHRGPDGSGMLVFGPAEGLAYVERDGGERRILAPEGPAGGGAASDGGQVPAAATLIVGHNRLAILDLSEAGGQPMATPDGRSVLAYNGEIYNHLELRSELEGLGHRFRSRSDTEVLLAALREWGRAALARLTGMFAFAFLDVERRRVLLARDPFGIKPLHLVRTPSQILFASEIPPLLSLTGEPRRARPAGLLDYLNDGLIDHGKSTLLEGVEALPPAHWLEIPLDRPAETAGGCYWRPDFAARSDLPIDEAARRLRDLFLRSVELHLRSDVPVGTMLSGGLDSSAIVMAMREVGGRNLDLHTFSYVGGQGAVSEEIWIDRVNEASGATAHKVHVRSEEISCDLDQLVSSQGEPFGGPAVYAQSRIFREAASAGVKVILDGQGADELLGGYTSIWPEYLASLLRGGRWPRAASFLLDVASRREGAAPGAWETLRNGLIRIHPDLHWMLRRLRGRRIRPWVSPAWCARHGLSPREWQPPRGAGPLHSALWRSVRERSLPGLLRFEDRNSMAWSLEARLPFLTPELAAFALSLPGEQLIGPDGTGKSVFRAAMRGIVPDEILDRRVKIGFAVPNRSWLALLPASAPLLEEAMALPAIRAERLAPALRVLRSGLPLPEGESFLVWRVILLALWCRHFDVECP